MKKFIYKLLIFSVMFFGYIHLIAFYLLWNDKYKTTVAGHEIYNALSKSKSKNKSKKLLIGDSVGRQLFDNHTHNDTINSLACNQAISMVGHFVLVNNYVNSGNKVDSLFLLFNPFTFSNNLDQDFTFHYFIKPFYTEEYQSLFTKTVHNQVSKVPYHGLSRYPPILTSNWAPDYMREDSVDFTFLSPISIEYLNEIKQLASKHGFKLILLPTPVSLKKKADVDKLNKNEISKNNFENEFKDYFKNIIYLEDSNFVDGTHLKDPYKYTVYYKENFLK